MECYVKGDSQFASAIPQRGKRQDFKSSIVYRHDFDKELRAVLEMSVNIQRKSGNLVRCLPLHFSKC